jgi:hypothetical protein
MDTGHIQQTEDNRMCSWLLFSGGSQWFYVPARREGRERINIVEIEGISEA